ncbi:MAG TPA: hypothetical protein V6C71_09200 [Coleofasciculaceae cyanobacterium]|jgi:hypothetical protein
MICSTKPVEIERDRLPEILKTLQISDFAKLNWLTKPLRAFEGRTPVEILKNGNEEDIEDLIIEELRSWCSSVMEEIRCSTTNS